MKSELKRRDPFALAAKQRKAGRHVDGKKRASKLACRGRESYEE